MGVGLLLLRPQKGKFLGSMQSQPGRATGTGPQPWKAAMRVVASKPLGTGLPEALGTHPYPSVHRITDLELYDSMFALLCFDLGDPFQLAYT